LALGGLPILYSASYPEAIRLGKNPGYFVTHQAMFTVVGVLLLVAATRLNLARLREWAWVLLAMSIVLLFVTLGTKSVNGAHRWLRVAGVTIQPSEIVKLTLLIYLASYLARCREWIVTSWAPVKHVTFVVGVVGILLLLQPHLSALCLVVGMAGVMMILAGLPFQRIARLALILVLTLVALYHVAPDEQRNRVKVWIGMTQSADERYQQDQSEKAIERGGLFGVGFCEGRQKLLYLPASHNDFVFSCLAEEFGFAGVLVTLTVFSVLVWRCFDIAHKCGSQFGSLLSAGTGTLLGLQCLAHVGVATGLLPTTGVTLPFFSAGGSALVGTLTALGLVLNVSRGPVPEVEALDYEVSVDRRRYRRPLVPSARAGRYGTPA